MSKDKGSRSDKVGTLEIRDSSPDWRPQIYKDLSVTKSRSQLFFVEVVITLPSSFQDNRSQDVRIRILSENVSRS